MSYMYTTPTSGVYTVGTGSTNTNTWATISNGSTNLTPHTIHVQGTALFDGDAEFAGDVKVEGKSLKESLNAIEARLAILRPNEELEEKWDNLRGLRQAYMELEAEIIEKEKIWSILKK